MMYNSDLKLVKKTRTNRITFQFLLDVPIIYQPPVKLTLPKPVSYPYENPTIMSAQDIRNTLLDDTWNANIRPDTTTPERSLSKLKLG